MVKRGKKMGKIDDLRNQQQQMYEKEKESVDDIRYISKKMILESEKFEHAGTYLDEIEKEFNKQTGIVNSKDMVLLFVATSLLCGKWVLLGELMPLCTDISFSITPNNERLDSGIMGDIDTKGKTKEDFEKTLDAVKKNQKKIIEELELCKDESLREKLEKSLNSNRKKQDNLNRVIGFWEKNPKFANEVTSVEKIREKLLDNSTNNSVSKYPTVSEILTRPVPYDAMKCSNDSIKLPQPLSGRNHHAYTLGHDPVLGWIVGPMNIMTRTISFRYPLWPSYWVNDNGNKIDAPMNLGFVSVIIACFERIKKGSESSMKCIVAAVVRQGLHFISDKYCKTGLPIPFRTADEAQKLIEEGWNSEEAKKCFDELMKTIQNNAFIIGIQYILSFFINQIIKGIHLMLYDSEKDGDLRQYEVRTRKILLNANCIATSSNILYTSLSNNISKMDIGGAIETIHRLISDTKYIHRIKEEFLEKRFASWIMNSEEEIYMQTKSDIKKQRDIVGHVAAETINNNARELSHIADNMEKNAVESNWYNNALLNVVEENDKRQYADIIYERASFDNWSYTDKEILVSILDSFEAGNTKQNQFRTAIMKVFPSLFELGVTSYSPEIFNSSNAPDNSKHRIYFVMISYYYFLGQNNYIKIEDIPEEYLKWYKKLQISSDDQMKIWDKCYYFVQKYDVVSLFESRKEVETPYERGIKFFLEFKLTEARDELEKCNIKDEMVAYLLSYCYDWDYNRRNLDRSLELVEDGFYNNDTLCAFRYSRRLESIDYEKYIEIQQEYKDRLLKLIECGNIFAKYEYALASEEVFCKDKTETELLLELVDVLPIAKFVYAKRINHGYKCEQNREESFRLFKDYMFKNHPEAQYYLAMCYEKGWGVEKNEKKAFSLFSSSYEGGYDCLVHLAYSYYYGLGVEQDYKKTEELCEKILSNYNYDYHKKNYYSWEKSKEVNLQVAFAADILYRLYIADGRYDEYLKMGDLLCIAAANDSSTALMHILKMIVSKNRILDTETLEYQKMKKSDRFNYDLTKARTIVSRLENMKISVNEKKDLICIKGYLYDK